MFKRRYSLPYHLCRIGENLAKEQNRKWQGIKWKQQQKDYSDKKLGKSSWWNLWGKYTLSCNFSWIKMLRLKTKRKIEENICEFGEPNKNSSIMYAS